MGGGVAIKILETILESNTFIWENLNLKAYDEH